MEGTDHMHQRTHFFKYAKADTALSILRTATIRYSSPLIFNDPFDNFSGLHFDFDLAGLPERVTAKFKALVLSDQPLALPPDDHIGKAVLLMREKLGTRGFPESLEVDMLRLWSSIADSARTFQRKFQQVWWEDMAPRSRILCISELNDSLLMWSHYADEHKGVVIEFEVTPSIDSSLRIARKVKYKPLPVPLFREDQWVDSFLGSVVTRC